MHIKRKVIIIAGASLVALAVIGTGGWYLFAPHSAKLSCSSPQIKGNINPTGTKIYHMPSGDFYDQTIIDANAGEQMFCTESEAVAAGFRKSSK